MPGYYSSVNVVPDYIVNEQKVRPDGPLSPQFTVMFWRELGFLSGYFGFEVLGSPMLDLTHASNTTLKGYSSGLQSLAFFGKLSNMVILDGRGEGENIYRILLWVYAMLFYMRHKLRKHITSRNACKCV